MVAFYCLNSTLVIMSETMGSGHSAWIPPEDFELMSAEEAIADIGTEI